eukprot:CAMPEP_0175144134 /NCGR_PEP_ID=MMETSP0087-20121206/13931_1 /TAXON_ID=136419 /ORGANISM="Unknown Unknown, Strain D1" /LENGTH=115 /DNA_ID=CAMNT_0016428505 /DNA_START=96 /DNA_END=441 /DNA_ORIENTATION=+
MNSLLQLLRTVSSISAGHCNLNPALQPQITSSAGFGFFFPSFVVEELVDDVHVREEHPPAAVAMQAKGVQSITFVIAEKQIGVWQPFVGNNFATRKATNWNDHDPRKRSNVNENE